MNTQGGLIKLSATAREIMTAPVISVTEDQTLKDVIELLAKHKFSGVPVVNADNIVVGILSDTDIVRYSHQVSVIPFADLSGWISPYTDIADMASLRQGIDMLSKTTVSQVMTKKVHTASVDTAVVDIARMMSRRNINRVPVLDQQGKLAGIVTRADVVRNMAGN
jgi:CBS domain-containing protein